MTHELHLGTADSSRNKGLALAAAEQDESECDEEEAALLVRKFKNLFRNNRYSNQRNNKERRTKSNLQCHKCGSTEHFIKDCQMWKTEKGKWKARDSRRSLNKENFNKTDFRKAIITAWEETESDDETIVPEEEETANLYLMATHESKEEKSKGK